jgi:hypothetical protein
MTHNFHKAAGWARGAIRKKIQNADFTLYFVLLLPQFLDNSHGTSINHRRRLRRFPAGADTFVKTGCARPLYSSSLYLRACYIHKSHVFLVYVLLYETGTYTGAGTGIPPPDLVWPKPRFQVTVPAQVAAPVPVRPFGTGLGHAYADGRDPGNWQ